MDTLLITAAILFAVFLLIRCAVLPRKPTFSLGGRMIGDVLLNRIAVLGKRCAVTKHGFGVYYKGVKLKNVISDIERKIVSGVELDDWEAELYISRERFLSVEQKAKNAARKSYTLGHADGYPRLFLLCNEIVKCTQGAISVDEFLSAVHTFEKYSPLTVKEREYLFDMLAFCICGLLQSFAASAKKRDGYYRNGIADGRSGKVDLDSLSIADYVCGLCECAPQADRAAIDRLLENNGIDLKKATESRCGFLAKICAVVVAAERTVSQIDVMKAKLDVCTEKTEHKQLSKRAVKALTVVPVVLIIIVAVLFCIFASARYSAVFTVIAVTVYAAFRLPLMIYAPDLDIIDFRFDLKGTIDKLFGRKKNSQNPVVRKTSEASFFGGEPEYSVHELCGGCTVAADNRGRVSVGVGDASDGMIADLVLLCKTDDGQFIDLAMCDGAFTSHKSIYRAASTDAEFAAELLAPIDRNCCCCKISVVNRRASAAEVEIDALCIPRVVQGTKKFRAAKVVGGSAVADNNDRVLALSFDRSAVYDADEAHVKKYKVNGAAVDGICRFVVDGFSKNVLFVGVVCGNSAREAERAVALINREGYYDFAESGARVYYALTDKVMPPSFVPRQSFADKAESRKNIVFDSLPLQPIEAEMALDIGGFTTDGCFFVDRMAEAEALKSGNILYDGSMIAVLTDKAVADVFLRRDNDRAINDFRDWIFDIPNINIVIGEGATVWSPTKEPLENGSFAVLHGFTHTEYRCSYNGCLCTLKVYAAHGRSALLFDLYVKNTQDTDRNTDVMFSVIAKENATVRRLGDSVLADNYDGGFSICASREVKEYALYKEAYFVRGRIDRACGFRSGGSTPAPTISVGVGLPANGMERVVFCLDLRRGEGSAVNQITERSADEYFDLRSALYNRFWKIRLLSDDKALNIMYKRALYQAYSAALYVSDDGYSVCDKLLLLSAAKYVSTKTTKNKLVSLFTEQDENGLVGEDHKNGVYLAAALIDFAEFTQDHGVFDEFVFYKPRRVHGQMLSSGATVCEHCMKAIDVAIAETTERSGIYDEICYDKAFIDVLHYFIDLCRDDEDRYKRYFYALGRAATRYSHNTEKIKQCNYLNASNTERALKCCFALYYSGEYNKAYNVLKFVNPLDAYLRGGKSGTKREPQWFSSDVGDCFSRNGTVLASMYFLIVTEQLLGIKVRGQTVRLDPKSTADTPEIKLEMSVVGGDVRIVVDATEKTGDWKMRINKINYGAVSFAPSKHDGEEILLYKDGL